MQGLVIRDGKEIAAKPAEAPAWMLINSINVTGEQSTTLQGFIAANTLRAIYYILVDIWIYSYKLE